MQVHLNTLQCILHMYSLTSFTKLGDISWHRDGEKLLPSAVTTVVNTLGEGEREISNLDK